MIPPVHSEIYYSILENRAILSYDALPFLRGESMLLPGQIACFDYNTLIANATEMPVRIRLIPLDTDERDPNCTIGILYTVTCGNAYGSMTWIETNPSNRYIIVKRGESNNCIIGPHPQGYGPLYTDFSLTAAEMEKFRDLYETLHSIEIPH